MPQLTVTVKWGKQKFENLELNTSDAVEVFKAQLYTLTQVPPERQKIMGVKGGPVKDDADWAALGIKPGQIMMLMGSAETLTKPAEQTVFAEDLPADVLAAKAAQHPGGLANLGNTCYLNSGLQVLKRIPEISTSLQKFTGSSLPDPVLSGMNELMGELDRSSSAMEVKPFKFVGTFRNAFPMFAEQAEGGRGYVQQDAEECWSTLISALAQRMTLPSGDEPSDIANGVQAPLLPHSESLRRNVGDMLFGLEMKSTFKCAETDAEPAYDASEAVRKLSCHISEKTAHLYNAIEVNLTETVEKTSPTLGREAQYTKTSLISRLPPYLTVQFVRFAWRKDTNKRAKILRQISFPDVLDVYNFCTPGLQARLTKFKWVLQAEDDAKAEAKAAVPVEEVVKATTAGDHVLKGAAAITTVEGAKAEAASSSSAMETDAPAAAEVDAAAVEEAPEIYEGDNKTGRYELFGVITHQGRTAEGGHYVAWVKKDEKKWLVFDDETVAEVDAERVKELYGGGDWHMAYVCLYRKMDKLRL